MFDLILNRKKKHDYDKLWETYSGGHVVCFWWEMTIFVSDKNAWKPGQHRSAKRVFGCCFVFFTLFRAELILIKPSSYRCTECTLNFSKRGFSRGSLIKNFKVNKRVYRKLLALNCCNSTCVFCCFFLSITVVWNLKKIYMIILECSNSSAPLVAINRITHVRYEKKFMNAWKK